MGGAAAEGSASILRPLIELKTQPNDDVFKSVRGEPIKPENFYDLFRDAQRVLEMPLRDLYATKDTYVSLALTSGVNLRLAKIDPEFPVDDDLPRSIWTPYGHRASRKGFSAVETSVPDGI